MIEPCCYRFTTAEGGARLAATAGTKNTLVTECGTFISTRLLHEEGYSVRGKLSDGHQRSVRLGRAANVKADAYELKILTDLQVTDAVHYEDVADWNKELEVKEVLVCTPEVFRHILEEGILTMTQVNILVIDSCHMIYKDEHLQYIMRIYKECKKDRPKILAITYPFFNTNQKSIDNLKETEEQTNNMQICQKIDINTLENTEMKGIDNVSSIDKKTESRVEEIGVYENLDDFDMYEKLEWKIDQLEKELCCQMDLAEDIDGCKRMFGVTTKPKEVVIEYGSRLSMEQLPHDCKDLEEFMRDNVVDTLEFLNDHRHDPTEIYGEELYDDFKNIPDPTVEPKQIFKEFLYILDELGPYAADKAAFSLLIKLEKLKIKIPYERHFLLLRMCTTVFVKIRCYAEIIFNKYPTDWDKIKTFSTPKLLRFVEVLEQFTPPEQKNGTDSIGNNNSDSKRSTDDADINDKTAVGDSTLKTDDCMVGNEKLSASKMLDDIDKCDFAKLGDKIEDRLNTIVANLKDLDMDPPNEAETVQGRNLPLEQTQSLKDSKPGLLRRWGRPRGRGRPPRNNIARMLQLQQNPFALCGIVFMQYPLMAKIMFMLCVDLSRSRPGLSYLRCQYCAVEPVCEQKESQKQGKRHEEVLKKFRMHECNLLLTTSALEEGIDLPRCNLVLRWDVPPSYRSYGLCRGRARAPRSAAAVLCDTNTSTDMFLHHLATYTELDQLITRKCGCGIQDEPAQEEEYHADLFTNLVKPYSPLQTTTNQCSCKNKNNKDLKNESLKIGHVESEKCINSDNFKISENFITSENCNSELENHQLDNLIVNSENKFCDNSNDTVPNKISDIATENNSDFPSFNDNLEIKNNSDQITITGKIELKSENPSNGCDKNNPNKQSADVTLHNEVISENIKNLQTFDSGDNNLNCGCDSLGNNKKGSEIASVDLSTAIALINRYCAKLPSDTFTRLAPQWWTEAVRLPGATRDLYVCTLRLPLNCPLKYNIVGHPMPTRVLARRMVALQACRILHKSGELDNQLMPIGKENFKAAELETANLNPINDEDNDDSARPGTTKRRQYYYKRTASAFTDCQPVIDTSDAEIDNPSEVKDTSQKKSVGDTDGKRNMLYAIVSNLWCALPERYNTRGRRLHAPQNANQALAILMARTEPTNLQIPAFPVYTRSGEVRVSVERVPDADVRLSPRRARLVRRFMRFVFTEVLRVRRRGMKLQSEGSIKNNYYIVPTIKSTREDGSTKIDVDWSFLELIYQHTETQKLNEVDKPILWYQDEEECDSQEGGEKKEKKEGNCLESPLLQEGETFVFDVEKYKEAVVTPWYRNQDQPQFFLVAEICWNLSPDSEFPSTTHCSFRSYYRAKYNVVLTQQNQPLLDVDHTSARLNLLTPRYVNRKGVALPVSSERTRRAKRDRLDQKQILVPELCRVHPFAAPLWFATVALPCVLYRINALLIADEIRSAVALDLGLGLPKIDEKTMPGFQWPALDFGWSLSEVLDADAEKSEKKKEEEREREREQKDKELREKESIIEKIEDSKEDSEEKQDDNKDKTINDILQEKEDAESGFEIGMWSNEMASTIPDTVEYDEFMEPLPSNLTFCTSASGGVNWCDPIQKPKTEFNPSRYSVADSDCSYLSSDFDTDDSDFDNDDSDDDTDTSGFCSSRTSNNAVGVRIEYKTAHEAEAVDLERKRKIHPAPQRDVVDEIRDRSELVDLLRSGDPDTAYVEKFKQSVEQHKTNIVTKGLIKENTAITDLLPALPESIKDNLNQRQSAIEKIKEIFPYKRDEIKLIDGQISLESIEKNKRLLLTDLKSSLSVEQIKKLNCFSMVDVDIDSPGYVNEKIMNVGFDSKEKYVEMVKNHKREYKPYYADSRGQNGKEFDFDYQPDLEGHPGPSPSVILQALTMSNANDGINLERLETIGDSFLKFAITAYLYCAHPTVHEGKLSHMRSKQVSNLNLYRLGRAKRLGARMIASKFEPHDNWLPPCHRAPPSPPTHNQTQSYCITSNLQAESHEGFKCTEGPPDGSNGCYIPYNLITQHSIPDKSIADCVEALIGAYLLECGPRGALLFMSWLGISVLPKHVVPCAPPTHTDVKSRTTQSPKRQRTVSDSSDSASDWSSDSQSDESTENVTTEFVGPVGARHPYKDGDGNWCQVVYGELKAPPSPLLRYIEDPEGELEQMLSGYDALERTLQYRFKDRSLLLQALTHASHLRNRLTDCYQRLEFLGDAILDYLITRHLYEDSRRHSPGALTDLRSALVNNTIFATLAVRHSFHKYFRHMSPGLNEVLTKYVKIQEENGHSISEEHYLIQEDELEQAEDVEVPKALGDLFESVAGAIFLDSGMSLGAVWQSYVRLMGAELEAFSAAAPKSPVRELLEAEPDTAKFGKPERLADGRRVRVCVEVFGRGTFKGIGRNYRIAKGTAARCALRHLKIHRR